MLISKLSNCWTLMSIRKDVNCLCWLWIEMMRRTTTTVARRIRRLLLVRGEEEQVLLLFKVLLNVTIKHNQREQRDARVRVQVSWVSEFVSLAMQTRRLNALCQRILKTQNKFCVFYWHKRWRLVAKRKIIIKYPVRTRIRGFLVSLSRMQKESRWEWAEYN